MPATKGGKVNNKCCQENGDYGGGQRHLEEGAMKKQEKAIKIYNMKS